MEKIVFPSLNKTKQSGVKQHAEETNPRLKSVAGRIRKCYPGSACGIIVQMWRVARLLTAFKNTSSIDFAVASHNEARPFRELLADVLNLFENSFVSLFFFW